MGLCDPRQKYSAGYLVKEERTAACWEGSAAYTGWVRQQNLGKPTCWHRDECLCGTLQDAWPVMGSESCCGRVGRALPWDTSQPLTSGLPNTELLSRLLPGETTLKIRILLWKKFRVPELMPLLFSLQDAPPPALRAFTTAQHFPFPNHCLAMKGIYF